MLALRKAPALLVLMLALACGSVVPWVEWCAALEGCTKSCDTGRAASCGAAIECAHPMSSPAKQQVAAEACVADGGGSCCSAEAEAPADESPRACCLHAPMRGLESRGVALDSPANGTPLALAAAFERVAGRAAQPARWTLARNCTHPSLRDVHAPPLGRAPPLA